MPMVDVSADYASAIYGDGRILSAQLIDGTTVYNSETIQSIKIKELTNDGTALKVGSCCCSSAEIVLINKDSLLNLAAFDGHTLLIRLGILISDSTESVPCGVFTVAASSVKDGGKYKLTAYDRMKLFDAEFSLEKSETGWFVSAGSGSATLAEDYTVADLLDVMCQLLGVETESLTFPNADYQPGESFSGTTTCRNVLSYIAQVAGSFARMTREGKLELCWYSSTGVTIEASSVFTKITQAEYTVPAIDRLLVTAKDYDLGLSYGDGENTYEIKDNPLLYSLTTKTEDEQQEVLEAIYNSISGISYTPIKIPVVGNPSIQAGDIVSVKEYRREFGGGGGLITHVVPVMSHTLIYNGGLRDTIEATGESAAEKKPQTVNDKLEVLNRKSNVLERDLDKTRSEIQSIEGGILELRTEIEQTKEEVTISIENTGGSNLISNSCGKGGTVDWTQAQGVTTGDVSGTMSKFAFRIASVLGDEGTVVPGRLARTVDLVNGNFYTCSCKYRKDAATVSFIVNGQEMGIAAEAMTEWQTASAVIDLRGGTSSERVVPISLTVEVTGGYFELSDLMLCQGESTVWTQAPNEIYGAGYRFDKDGLTISNDGAETQLVADASGTRVMDAKTGEAAAEFTRYGTDTKQLHSRGEISTGETGKIRMIPLESQNSVMWVIND